VKMFADDVKAYMKITNNCDACLLQIAVDECQMGREVAVEIIY
jgi:hypothetical protein